MASIADGRHTDEIRSIRMMRLASVLEATTLTLLVFIAVPLKYVVGLSQGSAIMGPVHGVAFLFFCWALAQYAAAGGGTAGRVVRLLAFAFIPLAGFVNERWLHREEQRLSAPRI